MIGVGVLCDWGVEQALVRLADGRGVVCGLVRRRARVLRKAVLVVVVYLLVQLVLIPADDGRDICTNPLVKLSMTQS